MSFDPAQALRLARETLDIEAAAIHGLQRRLNDDFARAVSLVLNASGRVVVMGMGKSGHIGRKIAATLASTGTPAQFVHGGDASHGDLGMITTADVVVMFSKSGDTTELAALANYCVRFDIPLALVTAFLCSTLTGVLFGWLPARNAARLDPVDALARE